MAVKVLIRRHFRPGRLKAVIELLNKARFEAMGQDGYISSETMWDCENPYHVVVASMWRDGAAWEKWKQSATRRSYEVQFKDLLDRPTEYETFILGLYPH